MRTSTLEKRYLGSSTYAEAARKDRTAYAECCIKRIKRKAEKILNKYILFTLVRTPDNAAYPDLPESAEYTIVFGKLRYFDVSGCGDKRAVVNSEGGCTINIFKGVSDYTCFSVDNQMLNYSTRSIASYKTIGVDAVDVAEHSWLPMLLDFETTNTVDKCYVVSEEVVDKIKGLIRGIITSPKDFVTIFNQITAALAA